jgi:hypothetical protein
LQTIGDCFESGARLGKHADWVDASEFKKVLRAWKQFGEFDVMVEAKRKDAALKMALQKTNQKGIA